MTRVYRHHNTTKMVVRNLAPNTTKDMLDAMFAKYGSVHSVKLATDVMTGRCGGVAYVSVTERINGAARRALDGSLCEGRVISVSIEHKAGRGIGQVSGKPAG